MRSEILFDMPEDEYRNAAGLSQSALKTFLASPMLYRRERSAPMREETPAMKFGRLFDDCLLMPSRLATEWVDDGGREYRTNEAKAWRKEQHAAGKSIYCPDDLKLCEQMIKAVWAHQEAAKLLAKARYQVSVFAPYTFSDGYQIQLKGRFDVLPEFVDAIVDVKKTVDCSDEGFGREIDNYRYDIQGVWYPMIYNTVNGTEDHRENFGFIAVQEDAFVDDRGEVYGVNTLAMKPRLIERAENDISRGLERYRYCTEKDIWPGVTQELRWVDVPQWRYRVEAEKEKEEAACS